MKFTAVLQSLHIGRTFQEVWKSQSKRKILDFGVRQQLEARGIEVVDAVEFLGLKQAATVVPQAKEIDGDLDESLLPKAQPLDQTHPDWHNVPCRVYHNDSTLLSGFEQAQNLVKAYLVANQLPLRVEAFSSKTTEEVHNKVQQAILTAHTLDATQKKLTHDPERPAHRPGWVFPRVYGIPQWKKNQQLMTKLFHIFDTSLSLQGVDVTQNQISTEFLIKTPLQLDGKPFLFDLEVGGLAFKRKPLQPYADEALRAELSSKPLPSIYPLGRAINIEERNIYRMEHQFPVRQGAPFDRLAMAVFHHNLPFHGQTNADLQGRLLLHSFGVAASYAQRLYGNDVKELPEPLTINCLQTDSQRFALGCLQLHSLDLDSSEASNLFWTEEPQSMFVKCDYVDGRPVIEGYNPRLVESLMALYCSQITA